MVNLLAGNPAWCRLLRREGIPFRSGPPGPDTAVLVLDAAPDSPDEVTRFLGAGGSLLAEARHAAALSGVRTRRARLRAVVPDDSPLFAHVGVIHLDADCEFAADANAGTSGRNRAVYDGPLAGGAAVLLPFHLEELEADCSPAVRVFGSGAPRPVSETVSRVSRGEVRRLVTASIRSLLHHRGLPLLRLARSPFPSDSLFGIRVDTDFDSSVHLGPVAGLIHDAGARGSWFINTEALADSLSAAVAALTGHDIQAHCHRHVVYPGFEDNLVNMKRAVELLAAAGVKPAAAAGPFGDWNPSWDRALARLEFRYSSEFGVGYDDLPFRPVVEGEESPVLQVPCHPVSPGRLLAAHADTDMVVDYFARYVARQAARQEPCFVYGHPANLARLGDSVGRLVRHGIEVCGGTMTMNEYAGWWERREAVRFRARASADAVELEVETGGVDVVVERPGGFCRLELRSGRYPLDTLGWRPPPRPVGYSHAELAAETGRSWRVLAREALRTVRRQTRS